MNSVKLSEKSFEELDKIRLAIENKPINRMPTGSFYIYTKAARRKLHAIAWAITYKLAASK